VNKYPEKINSILKLQGKRIIVGRIEKQQATLETIINTDDYYISDLDLWVLFERMNVPVILFYSTSGKTMTVNTNWIYLCGNNMDLIYKNLYFIRCPVNISANVPNAFHLITPTHKFRELGEMATEISMAIGGDAKYVNNILPLDTFFNKFSYIKVKR
jgi:hypothetical protein